MKLGVIFHPRFAPETLVNFARRAEAAGFDELWLWEDAFLAGALTSAATVLANTERIAVGIGLMPITIRNPLFIAMEMTTLARLYPGRFLPGFGHGVDAWLKQVGAAPPSTLNALSETVPAVRALLQGKTVSAHGSYIQLENVKLIHTPAVVPPIYIGAMREKTLQLAGRIGDGTILTEMSSPAYVRWAKTHIQAGMTEAGRLDNQLVVYVQCKVDPTNGATARQKVRQMLSPGLLWAEPHLKALGIADEVKALHKTYGATMAEHMPDAWLDDLCAAGTPDQAAATIQRLVEAGADSIVLQPLDGDPNCLDEYITHLLPRLGR
jgi:alkanesulfonate monooxygenase SsuD/methylene tetrahydromethanopterin reductase-like flavin-dependent oxidoreductase (luciferase family)